MLNRIFVGLALVASLFVAAFGFFSVKPRIEQIVEQRKTEKEAKVKAETELASTKKTLKATDDKLKKTEGDLKTTTEQKTAALAEAKREKDNGAKLAADLKTTTEERDVVRAEIFVWKQLGLTPEQVRGTIKQLKDVTEERDAFVGENKTLQRSILKLQNKIDDLIGTNMFVALPASARGKVVAVDPRWEFCVLDFGDNKGALERGELLVNRNGQLVARLRIQSVQNERCVANIMTGWKLGDVLEGDAVFPAGN